MILDYNYSRNSKELSISYIDNNGTKQLLRFGNVSKIPTYFFHPNGRFTNWDGSKCERKLTSNISRKEFELKEFIFNLKNDYQEKLENKTFPKLYTFDIETQIKSKYEFTEPTVADMPILTISIVNPDLNCVVLGTKELSEDDNNGLQNKFIDYLNGVDFYKKLKLDTPKIKYIKFDSEELMLRYFLEKIVAKVPIIAGWNSIGYDWCYITHRIKYFFPKLSIKLSSITNEISNKIYTNKKNETIKLPHPNHTLVLDMMDIIEQHDLSVMPTKESMNLDYVASQTLGAHKIEYDGDLQELYETDYQKYVFYNAIDSILVQLIDKRFKIMHQFYIMSLFCKESINKCFSKILLTESLIFKYYFENNIKIVPENRDEIERGNLIGAYVKEPKPGKWNWMCCNDFASLYPSTMITCNLSFDNFLGKLGREFNQNQIDKFKKDKNYFVSVNNCVYKNDKDYTFKIIEKSLKSQRDKDKYLSKVIDATLHRDLKHFLHNQPIEVVEYPDNVREYFKGFGYDIVDANSFKDLPNIDEFVRLVENESTYLFGMEQAVKLMMNSMYGGSSHVSFYWFNMDFANDITGESRWLIHKMEEHIPEHFNEEWLNLKDVHKKLGIEVDENVVKELLKNKEDIVTLVYGDSCSGDTVISLKDNKKTIESLFNECSVVFEDRGKEFGITDKYILNFNGKELVYNKIKWVIRHKTNKSKWQIHTKNNTIEVTGDHSCIIWKNNKMVEISPKDMNIGDLVINSNGDFEKITLVECVGNYDSEYVYDIEVDTDNINEHNFFGNGILIHNTDSVDGSSIITTDNGNKTIEELFKENEHNNKLITHKGHELVSVKYKILNYNDKGELEFQNAKYIMRHKVSKPKWRLKTKLGKEIFVTNDHSMIVFRDGEKLEVKPYEILKTDKILITIQLTEYIFDEIEVIECVGEFEDQYVYDIEMIDDTHTFIANDILVHNSLYSSYENLLKTVKGYKDMTTKQLLDIVLGVNLGYLDEHNCEYIKELYNERHGNSFHKFELETVAKSGVWLDVKKRYGQLLLWKDGNFYDEDDLPIKVKGLEVIKASYPTLARKINKEFLRFLLEYDGNYLSQELSIRNRNYIEQFKDSDIEDICANIRVNKYTSHVKNDTDEKHNGPIYETGASFNSKALAMYNWLNNTKKLGSAPIYGGKVKCYTMKGSSEKNGDIYFAFESMNYPNWADEYAPVDRMRMYQKYVLDPFNRILKAIKLPILNIDGSIQLNLF